MKAFLKPFYTTTLKLEEHKATLKNILFTMDIIIKYFKELLVSLFFLRKIKKTKLI